MEHPTIVPRDIYRDVLVPNASCEQTFTQRFTLHRNFLLSSWQIVHMEGQWCQLFDVQLNGKSSNLLKQITFALESFRGLTPAHFLMLVGLTINFTDWCINKLIGFYNAHNMCILKEGKIRFINCINEHMLEFTTPNNLQYLDVTVESPWIQFVLES